MVFSGAGRPLEAKRFALPTLGEREVLVRVTGCTLCGSDLHTYTGRRSVPVPTVLGHEILGHIAVFGPGAARQDFTGQPLAEGDRVTWAIVANCGDCFYCRRDLPAKCLHSVKFGHEPLRDGQELTGGLAEYCVLPRGSAIFRLPDQLSDKVACPANCATATVAAVLEAAGAVRKRAVLVLGAGMLGLTACAMANLAGASAVICCDVLPERRQKAMAFGASAVASPDNVAEFVTQLTDGHGVDAVLELSGSTDALEQSLPLLRLGGTAVLAGAVFPTRPLTLEPERLVRRNLTLRGVHNYAPRHLEAALRFLAAAERFPFASLVSSWLPLAHAEQAFQQAHHGHAYRIGVRCAPE
ncbi:MAG: zinc-binding dehydrogenase [Planctomycetes bacterium]|nr:zinc-binding dehydrogenase [Planctomycetota bacterium]